MMNQNNTTTKPLNQNKMKEKEKAEELIEKFGKELAPKVVDEIINSSPSLPILGDGGTFSEDIELSTIYWQAVKQLLINL